MVELGRPCSEERLAHAAQALGLTLPATLRDLYRAGDGRYRKDGKWWVVWQLDRVVADTTDAWRQGTLPAELVAFGDDGTGDPFCLPAEGTDEVVRWSWIDQAHETVGTMSEFLAEWAPGDSA